jgi:acetyl-CoA C-acetyltransferase
VTVEPVVAVSGVRTAIGRFGGALKDVDAHELAAVCIREALSRAQVGEGDVDEVVLGQVGQVGADAYNARRAAIAAGIPAEKTAMNVNRLCASGLQAVVTAARELQVGAVDVVVAGGDESMSRQPFLDYGARGGWRLGSREQIDGTLSLVTDPFGRYPMGVTAENVAERYGVDREAQDALALRSQERAEHALEEGFYAAQVVPVDTPAGPVDRDEHPRPGTTLEALRKLRPAFRPEGTVTAGNSAGINDGAAALVLMREADARTRSIAPRLRLVSSAVTGIEPEVMGCGPIAAIPRALERAGLRLGEIDLFELNEAFAAQAVAVVRALDIDPERLNVDGGAIALGHPVGATGAILVVKLMHALGRTEGRYGVVSMCIGGGQGMAAVFERA